MGEEGHLLLEEDLVVVEVEAEEGEGLDEGPPPQDDLGPARGDGVQGGEALEDAHRIVGAHDRHRRTETDARGLPGDGREDHLGRGDGEVLAVVLTDAEEIDAELVGENGLAHHVADHAGVTLGVPLLVVGDVAEGVESEFQVHRRLSRVATTLARGEGITRRPRRRRALRRRGPPRRRRAR